MIIIYLLLIIKFLLLINLYNFGFMVPHTASFKYIRGMYTSLHF